MSEEIRQELKFYDRSQLFVPALFGAKNINKLFICRAAALVCKSGSLSFIVPMSLLGDRQAAELRKLLLRDMSLATVEAFPQKDDPKQRLFVEAKLSTTIFVARGNSGNASFTVRTNRGYAF